MEQEGIAMLEHALYPMEKSATRRGMYLCKRENLDLQTWP